MPIILEADPRFDPGRDVRPENRTNPHNTAEGPQTVIAPMRADVTVDRLGLAAYEDAREVSFAR
jgi:hypothetical protein